MRMKNSKEKILYHFLTLLKINLFNLTFYNFLLILYKSFNGSLKFENGKLSDYLMISLEKIYQL